MEPSVASKTPKHTRTGEPREVATYNGAISGLKDFITAEKLPLTVEFTQQNSDRIFNSGINKQVSKAGLEHTHTQARRRESATKQ
jgi:hypothetical protein